MSLKQPLKSLNNDDREVDYCLGMLDSLQNITYILNNKKTALISELDLSSTVHQQLKWQDNRFQRTQ